MKKLTKISLIILVSIITLISFSRAENGNLTITYSDPIAIGDRETGDGWVSIKEISITSSGNIVNLGDIDTGAICGDGYHLLTWNDWENLGERVGIGEVDNFCNGYYEGDKYYDKIFPLGYPVGFTANMLWDYQYYLKFSFGINAAIMDPEDIKRCIGEPGYREYPNMLRTTSENSADVGIYYDQQTNQFKKIIIIIETDPETGDSFIRLSHDNITTISSGETLLCISDNEPTLKSNIVFINENNGFRYETNLNRGSGLSDIDIAYINEHNSGYNRFDMSYNSDEDNYGCFYSDTPRTREALESIPLQGRYSVYDEYFEDCPGFKFYKKFDIQNEIFKYNTVLVAHGLMDDEYTLSDTFSIGDRESGENFGTFKEVKINSLTKNYLDVLAVENICGTGYHFITMIEFANIGVKISPKKRQLYAESTNNYENLLSRYLLGYDYAFPLFLLGDFPHNYNYPVIYGMPNGYIWHNPMLNLTSYASTDIYQVYLPTLNMFVLTSMSIEVDTETQDPRVVVGEAVINRGSGSYFLCVAEDENLPIETEVVFINNDNNFEYKANIPRGQKLSLEDLEYINEQNPNYIWYVADTLEIDLENEIFKYDTVLTAHRAVDIVDTENDEIIRLKSIQNSPYFTENSDIFKDEITRFYNKSDFCGSGYHAVQGAELTGLINLGNLSSQEYNRRGDNTLTYCASNPQVVVTFVNENNNSQYEMYIEKGHSMKSREINIITKNNTGYEWYNGENKIDLTEILFNKDTTLYAKNIENSENIKPKNENSGYSGGGGGGGGGGGNSKNVISNDSNKSIEQPIGNQENSSILSQNDDNISSGEIVKNLENTKPMDSSEQVPQNNKINTQDSLDKSPEGITYSQEYQQAYKFAKDNGITTMPTIQEAKMDGKLTRIQMAKMLSQYAINVLGQKPDETKNVKFRDVTEKKDVEYDNGVTLAYQLGIMGQNMPNNRFRPNDEVTRAEFVTALSRMIYNTTDGEYEKTSKYYIPHMANLYNEGIVNNTDPSMKERRGYVMIMLMRSVK